MNRKTILSTLALAFVAAGNAYAESPTVPKDNFVSSKSRAEVQAELFSYKKGGVNPWSTQYNPIAKFRSSTTRDQVVAEYMASRDEVAAMGREDSGSSYFAQGTPRGADTTTLAGQPANPQ